jgi:hypothetical protein
MAVLLPAASMEPQENVMKIITTMLTACALSATASAQVPDFTPQTPLIAG